MPENAAFLTSMDILLSITRDLESMEIRKLLLRLLTSNFRTESLDTIKGRTFKLCGLIGAIINESEVGMTNGPPTESEYPVDPVAVDTIIPSAQYVFKKLPSKKVLI